MYRRMLVPLDGSDLAEGVFVYAKELAGRLDIDVTFLHVYPQGERELCSMHQAYVERAAEIVKHQAEAVQQSTGIQAGNKVLEMRGALAVSHPAEEILRYADESGADLILMATHGRSGIKRWALGSVADKVLRASEVPVWLVRAKATEDIDYDKWPNRVMLVPLDGSKLAESVLPHVEALAKQRGAEMFDIVLIRVHETSFITADYPEASMPLSWGEHVANIKAKFKKECEAYLQRVGKQLTEAGLRVQSEVLMGNTVDEIANYAHEHPFNLIVMSTHGHSGIMRATYGSVADRILHEVTSPIFLVRPH